MASSSRRYRSAAISRHGHAWDAHARSHGPGPANSSKPGSNSSPRIGQCTLDQRCGSRGEGRLCRHSGGEEKTQSCGGSYEVIWMSMKLTIKDVKGNDQGEYEVKFALAEGGKGTQAVHDT